MKINQVFVYGTLMSGMSNQHVIISHTKRLEPGKARGLLYHLPYGYPAMIDGEGEITGELVELIDPDQVLEALDWLEGYRGEENPDNLYHRVIRQVGTADGRVVSAYVYLWAKERELGRLGVQVASGNWREYKQKKQRL